MIQLGHDKNLTIFVLCQASGFRVDLQQRLFVLYHQTKIVNLPVLGQGIISKSVEIYTYLLLGLSNCTERADISFASCLFLSSSHVSS